MNGPLHGLRVIELAAIGPCPHAAMMLSDLGAEVIRIARPRPGFDLADSDTDTTQRGRTVVTVDLRSEEGRNRLLDLVRRCDVLVEGYRPGVLERLGLGPDRCLAVNPSLVLGRVTGWGQNGPLAMTAGHDINYLSITGTLSALGADDRPSFPLNLLADFGGGSMLLTVGVLAALFERDRSGKGQVIDAAMVDGVAQLSQMLWSMRGQGQWSDERAANVLDGGAPFYDVYRCSDGKFLAVGALEPKFFKTLVTTLGLDELWSDFQYDRSKWEELRTAIGERIATHTRDEWTAVFEGVDACVSPVVELAEAPGHPHLVARNTLPSLDGLVQAAPAPRFGRTPAGTPRASQEGTIDAVLKRWSSPTEM